MSKLFATALVIAALTLTPALSFAGDCGSACSGQKKEACGEKKEAPADKGEKKQEGADKQGEQKPAAPANEKSSS